MTDDLSWRGTQHSQRSTEYSIAACAALRPTRPWQDGVILANVESLENHEHAVVVGESGVGKTCTLRALRNRLPDSVFRLTYCHNASLGRRDFYRQLCLALQLPVKATAAGVFGALTNNVQELSRERIDPVFILDGAQLLRDDELQHLHILSNYS